MKNAERYLLLAGFLLLAYVVWLNTKELVDLELEVDRIRGALEPTRTSNKVSDLERVARGSFEESLKP